MERKETYLLQSMYNLIPSLPPASPGHLGNFLGELAEEINENHEIPAELSQAIVSLAEVAQLIKDDAIKLSEEHAWYLPLDEKLFK